MNNFQEVLTLIAPRQVGKLEFLGDSLQPQQRVFGGQVVAQALMAANLTGNTDMTAHSLHAYFLRAGDPTTPIKFEVDPIRDGRSFATRRIVARQHGHAIFNAAISYHKHETGISHCFEMPDENPPKRDAEDSSTFRGFTRELGEPNLMTLFQIERQRVTKYHPEIQPPFSRSWFRAIGPLQNDTVTHQAALAMISDFSLLSAVFYAHSFENSSHNFMAASLDHSIWFHQMGKMDEWVLYDCDSPRSGGGRGFSRGAIWDRSGVLLANTAQESLIRPSSES